MFPESKLETVIGDVVTTVFHGLAVEENPAKVFSACAKANTFFRLLRSQQALIGHRLDGLGIDKKLIECYFIFKIL